MPANTDIATRAYVVALKATAGKTSIEIAEITGLSRRLVDLIYSRAIERGFDPNHRPIKIHDAFLADAPRPGRPSKKSEAKDEILTIVRCDRYGREKNMC